jgi:hypothetical protein
MLSSGHSLSALQHRCDGGFPRAFQLHGVESVSGLGMVNLLTSDLSVAIERWMRPLLLQSLFLATLIGLSLPVKSQGVLLRPGDVVEGRFNPGDFEVINEAGTSSPGFLYTGFMDGPVHGRAKFQIRLFENATSAEPFVGQDVDMLDNWQGAFRFDGQWIGTQYLDREGFYRLTYEDGDPITFKGVQFDLYEGALTYRATVVPEPAAIGLVVVGLSVVVHKSRARRS